MNAGNDAYLNVYATSSVVPVLVQWWYNGQPLGGETSWTLGLGGVGTDDPGDLDVLAVKAGRLQVIEAHARCPYDTPTERRNSIPGLSTTSTPFLHSVLRDGGTLCLNRLRYRPRGGTLIHWLFVRRDVERIFRRRQPRLRKIFDPRANLKDLRESG